MKNKNHSKKAITNGLIGYTLLGKYETKKDLIKYKGNNYQPQITINVIMPESMFHEINIRLDERNGFALINISNKSENTIYDNIQLKNAMINFPNGAQCFITINEARNIIFDNLELFIRQNDPIGHRCYY